MKLSIFQIINCFGFRDSGKVNLLNSKDNFIYILGRNSSGTGAKKDLAEAKTKGIKIPFIEQVREEETSPFWGDFENLTVHKTHKEDVRLNEIVQ